jgi:hypothetical protein
VDLDGNYKCKTDCININIAFIGMNARNAKLSLGKRCKRVIPNIMKTGVMFFIMFSCMFIGLLPNSQKYISKPFRERKSEYMMMV